MTERKTPGLSFESWIDKQVREATERGEFDNLPGAGKPIPAGAADENWWIRSYLKREGAAADALLPESIVLRRERERMPETVRDMASEAEVRAAVAELNDRIVQWLRMPTEPHVPIGPLKVEDVVETWRAERAAARAARSPGTSISPPVTRPTPERRWWRRLFGM
ncbi:DnaJ family domain-containing protein [Nocardia sp. CDC160]|uniref:DnaJ family domain-containing protein n=1 Tax=Nocardia sp. CDC160 TaxID=3112166 RepID=UPI002DBD96E6|nr:DnaJ family domain-containing protein [Nocardia sp. CDC160]MEC3914790.1 DnaJ family domain-containing protein [Nocardia sp. CDC160]